MAEKTITRCANPTCGYPIAVEFEGQTLTCPMCSEVNEAVSQGVTIPTWLFAGGIGLLAGILLGPPIIASTEEGRRWLERQAREAIRK